MWARLAAFQGGDVEQLRAAGEERMAGGSPFPEGVKKALLLGTPDGDGHVIYAPAQVIMGAAALLMLGTAAEYKVSEVADRNSGVVLKIDKQRLTGLVKKAN